MQHDCWERAYFKVCTVHKQKLCFDACSSSGRTTQQEPAPSPFPGQPLSFTDCFLRSIWSVEWWAFHHYKAKRSQRLPWLWSQEHAVFTFNFCFLQKVLEGKVKSKTLTADIKQCLLSANTKYKQIFVCMKRCLRYHALTWSDMAITEHNSLCFGKILIILFIFIFIFFVGRGRLCFR